MADYQERLSALINALKDFEAERERFSKKALIYVDREIRKAFDMPVSELVGNIFTKEQLAELGLPTTSYKSPEEQLEEFRRGVEAIPNEAVDGLDLSDILDNLDEEHAADYLDRMEQALTEYQKAVERAEEMSVAELIRAIFTPEQIAEIENAFKDTPKFGDVAKNAAANGATLDDVSGVRVTEQMLREDSEAQK